MTQQQYWQEGVENVGQRMCWPGAFGQMECSHNWALGCWSSSPSEGSETDFVLSFSLFLELISVGNFGKLSYGHCEILPLSAIVSEE